jgi:hypothetical protein
MTSTSPENFERANALLSGDTWDADGVCSVYLPRPEADRLLAARGWHYHDPLWFPPHLPFDGDYRNGYGADAASA